MKLGAAALICSLLWGCGSKAGPGGVPGTGGAALGTGGAGTGGAAPGTGGAVAGTGGAAPGTGGAGTGGAGTGGAAPGTGGRAAGPGGGVGTMPVYIKPSNPDADDRFGISVAIDGDTLVVGAPGEDGAGAANPDDDSAAGAGAAYVFVRSAGGWTQQAYLKASNAEPGDGFGEDVAIHGDTIVVGAAGDDNATPGVNPPDTNDSASIAGAAYVFVRSGTTWTEQAYLKASNPGTRDVFGTRVAIHGDTIVVGAQNEASAATGVNGNQLDNSAPLAGAAYVFVRSGTTWTQQAYLKASNTGVGTSDQFGVSVAVHGDTVAVGSPLEGSNATGIDGDQANELASGAGAVYVFVRSGTTWRQEAYVKASNTAAGDTFGISLALDQDLLAVGAYNEGSAAVNVGGDQADNSALRAGAVYMLSRSSGVWSHVSYIKASNTGTADWFGYEVALKGGVLAVGAGREDSAATGFGGDANDNSVTDAGAAYVLVRSGATWSPFGYFKALNPSPQDSFGFATGISAGRLVVGAPLEDGSASRIGGPFDDLLEDAGAVYVFE